MLTFLNDFRALANDKRGVTALEYGLIAGLMAVVLIAALAPVKAGLTATFASIGAALTPAVP